MHTTEQYTNRDIDAHIMVCRLRGNVHITTAEAEEMLGKLDAAIKDCVRNYKDTRFLERDAGILRLLLRDRELWSTQGAFDDCSHWVSNMDNTKE